MKKILYVVNDLNFGGVTTILLNTLSKFDYKRFEVTLLVLNMDNYENVKEKIPKNIKILSGDRYFNINSRGIKELVKTFNVLKIIKKVLFSFCIKTKLIKRMIKNNRRKIISEEYDCEIAYSDGFATLFTAFGDGHRKVCWFHSDYKVFNYSARYKNIFRDALLKYDEIVAVSEEASRSIKEIYNLDKDAKVIINIQNLEKIIPLSNEEIKESFDNEYINLISVGRLEKPKAYLRYVDVHKRLIDDGYKIRFYLIGDGSEFSLIDEKIRNLNIEDSFIMLGFKKNPFPYVKKANLFVLCSILEGMPTVVFESLYLKTPVISTKVAGIDYLLGNKKYGIIVENSEDALYEGIKNVLNNSKIISEFKKNLNEYKVNDEENLEKIYSIIEK